MKEYHKIQTVFKRDLTIPKTLLTGQYSLPEFEYLKDNIWVFTEKVDGMNIRVMFDGEKVSFGGKTDNAQIPAPLILRLEERFLPQLWKFIDKFGKDSFICLYGEGYGAKIQKGGGNYRQDQSFVLFDVYVKSKKEFSKGWWLARDNIEDIATFFSIDTVPIIGKGTLADMVEMAKNGFTSKWGDFIAEGIVARPKIEIMTRSGQRIITKIKHRDFQ